MFKTESFGRFVGIKTPFGIPAPETAELISKIANDKQFMCAFLLNR